MTDKTVGISYNVRAWTVLIVDDKVDNLIIAQTALQFNGAKVYVAANGKEGLELLNQVSPTFVLLDLSMPKMDGWEMFRHMRGNPATAAIPVVALTAHAMTGDKERILEMGFNGYIPKPFDVTRLVTQLQEMLCETAQTSD